MEHPQIQRVLAHPPTACVTQVSTNEVVELFDGGWLSMKEEMPHVRVIVARHRTPSSGKRVSVGKCIDEWVYEVFITTLPTDGFLVEDVLDLYHGRGAFEAVLAEAKAIRILYPGIATIHWLVEAMRGKVRQQTSRQHEMPST